MPTGESKGGRLESLAGEYLRHLLDGERRRATELVLHSVDAGIDVRDIYLDVFQPTQYEIGRLWQENAITVADEHYCTAATQLAMSLLYPRLFDPERQLKNANPFIVSAVAGELHELGARMVADMLELEGWDTVYLGASTPVDALVRAVRARHAPLVSISVTLPAHARHAEELIDAVRASANGDAVKVLVGGRAFHLEPGLWESVGADATALDALEAVRVVEGLFPAGRPG